MTSLALSVLKFKPLTEADFPLLFIWLNSGHVLEHWDSQRTIDEVQAKYSEKLNSNWQQAYIVSTEGTPFGYIQSYRANKAGPGWWQNEPETTIGIDQFIGAPGFLSRGLGVAMAREFSEKLLAQSGNEKIITDPKPDNVRAIKCYSAAGFKKVGIVNTPDGEALLMEKY